MYHAACEAEFLLFNRSWSSFLLTILDLNIISYLYSYSNPAEHYLVLFALNIIVLVHLWAAGEKTQPSNGHMREKRPYPSSYCTEDGRMSGMLVSGKTFLSPST